jgi:hypothetical protein
MSKKQVARRTIAADRIAGRADVFSGLELEDRLGIGLEKRFLILICRRRQLSRRPS